MRESGVAQIVDELELGVASISVGVRVRDELAAVLNVTGPTHRFDEARGRPPARSRSPPRPGSTGAAFAHPTTR